MMEALQDTTEPAPEDTGPALLPGTLTQIMAMPVWIVRSAPLIALRRRSPLALRVLLYLWAHGRGVGSRCVPGERRLAALNKPAVPSVSRAIRLLEAAKWITVRTWCSASTRVISAVSPTSPITSGTPATA